MLKFNDIYFDQTNNFIGLKKYLEKNLDKKTVNTFILVSSLPNNRSDFRINRILNELGIPTNVHIPIGDNCTAILDAFYISENNFIKESNVCIVCLDEFSEYATEENCKEKPELKEWKNCTSAIVFKKQGKYSIEIKNKYAIHDNSFHDMISFGTNSELKQKIEKITRFKRIDLLNEEKVIRYLSKIDNMKISDYDAFIFTNREDFRTEAIISSINIPKNKVFSSRKIIGHTGGSDILYNLQSALAAIDNSNFKILISANGLGYSWKSMSLRIEKT